MIWWAVSQVLVFFNPFFRSVPFDTLENIRKPKRFYVFRVGGDQKGPLRRKGLIYQPTTTNQRLVKNPWFFSLVEVVHWNDQK